MENHGEDQKEEREEGRNGMTPSSILPEHTIITDESNKKNMNGKM